MALAIVCVNYLLNKRLFISKNIVCEDDVATKVIRGAWVASGVERLRSVGWTAAMYVRVCLCVSQ